MFSAARKPPRYDGSMEGPSDASDQPQKANAEVVAVSRGWFRRPSKRFIVILAAFAGLLVLGGAGAAWATLDYTNDYAGRLLPGADIAGVELGGLTYEEAVDQVHAAIRPELDRPITVRWEKRTWTVTPRELGARNDAEQAVAAAIEASRDASFLDRMKMKVLGEDLDFAREVAITFPKQGVKGFIQGLASNLDKDVREAEIDYSTGWVEIVPARTGREVVRNKSRRALMDALVGGDLEVDLTVKTIQPETKEGDFDQILLVRIGENKLYLYEDGKIVREWTVATGLPEYPTPTGTYEVTELRYMPTWINPAPDTWGANMPESIPPGPGNPLGLRAINWSAPAIRFHGTSATYSLGFNASHGCVRMANSDVIELYDMIEVGTPIVSIVVAPAKPLYASAPDPIVVEEDAGDAQPSTDAAERGDSRGKKKDR